MSVSKHIKEHAMLGLSGQGTTVTVGSGGNFSTFADAIAYISTLTHFEDITNTGIPSAFDAQDATWAQGSKLCQVTLGSYYEERLTYSSNSHWLKFNDDTTELFSRVSAGGAYYDIVFKTERQSASLAVVGTSSLTVLKPIYHRILLLEDVNDEKFASVNVPMNLIIEGINKSILFGAEYSTGLTGVTLEAGSEARYGTYHFKNLKIAGVSCLISSVGTEANNTRVIVSDCDLIVTGSDWSGAQKFGEFEMCRNNIYVGHHTGGAHFIQVACAGDFLFYDNKIFINFPNALSPHTGMFTGNGSSVAIFARNDIYLQDNLSSPALPPSGFVLVYGSKGNSYTLLDSNTVYASENGKTVDYDVTLVKGNQQAGNVGQRAGAVLEINNCHFVGKFARNATLYDISTLTQSPAASGIVRITNSDTKTEILKDATYDVIESIDLEFRQETAYAASITPNLNLGSIIDVAALTGGIAVNAPTDPQDGQQARFLFVQDATGSHAINWNAVFKVQTLTAGGTNTKAIYDFEFDGTDWIQTNTAQWL